ncbi:MAG: Mlr3941 protein [uncultured Quadrisphaera sp.]|uniref:Mlr3941 protein n=1 Tax=uncultured Quadrisphaera sp. TaxID=904978 RepID=A0A6J4PET9_9ACTN|nr:MAG: Mlr3941 protein [uncultured Quadrisphaera sp.]
MTTTRPPTTTTRALVLGGTGKSGRRVAQQLRRRGTPVRLGSRSGLPPFAWHDRRTWEPVLDGVDAAYLAYAPDLAVAGAVEVVEAFTALAVDRGVRRVVLLSGRGEPGALAAERAVRAAAAAAGAACTVVRSSWFMQGFSEDAFLEPVLAGELALPVGDVPEPFVDVEDVAEVAVAALTAAGHEGRVYEVTGPEPLTFAAVAQRIAAACGRPVAFRSVAPDDFAATLAASGAPPEAVELMAFLFTEVLDGRNARVADGVQQALGRAPRSFTDFARAAAASGAWSPRTAVVDR